MCYMFEASGFKTCWCLRGEVGTKDYREDYVAVI